MKYKRVGIGKIIHPDDEYKVLGVWERVDVDHPEDIGEKNENPNGCRRPIPDRKTK